MNELERIKIIDNHINKGVKFINPYSNYIDESVEIDNDVTIGMNNIICGKTIISKGVNIGSNCEIKDSIIGEESIIKQSCIFDSVIGKKTTIGPFSHLRDGCVIGDKCRIGNYVEIKKSSIGNNTKCAHLTYIGDCICGENVNFGCGVVTCNYDGKNKLQTKIFDNVFIGSNVNLIAPISIGNNSFIAAGTTVTKDVNDNEFVIGRVRQSNTKRPHIS